MTFYNTHFPTKTDAFGYYNVRMGITASEQHPFIYEIGEWELFPKYFASILNKYPERKLFANFKTGLYKNALINRSHELLKNFLHFYTLIYLRKASVS